MKRHILEPKAPHCAPKKAPNPRHCQVLGCAACEALDAAGVQEERDPSFFPGVERCPTCNGDGWVRYEGSVMPGIGVPCEGAPMPICSFCGLRDCGGHPEPEQGEA